MILTITNYSFNTTSNTITFSDYAAIALERIVAVKNMTTGAWIYKATDTVNYGGTVATNVLTYAVSDAGMSNGDKLLIKYDTTDAGMEPFGALQVNNGFQTLFYDSWPGAVLDVTDKWTVTGNTPTIANGLMTMSATVSSYNAIQTKDAIRANVGYSLVRNGISLETSAAIGAGRLWGLGTPANTPAAAVLAQEGCAFEIDQATGALLAVTYTNGARTTIATLTRPTDGLTHAYGVYFRVTQAFWLLDNVVVASKTFPNVALAELPALIVRQNAASFTGTPAFVNIAHLTADTARQSTSVGDPVIGTRQARVKKASTAAAATDEALVVSLSPNSAVTPPAITKGTQGATGFTTQDLKDAGRVYVNFAGANPVTGVTTEALLTMTPYRDLVAGSTATTFAVTSGKRLRLQAIIVTWRNNTAAAGGVTVRLRLLAGTVLVNSPVHATLNATVGSSAVVGGGLTAVLPIPDGLELSGTMQLGLTHIAIGAVVGFDVNIIGYEY